MTKRTSTISDALSSTKRISIIVALLFGFFITNTALASDNFLNVSPGIKSTCSAGFADIWIIGQACDIGGSTNIKADDAIHVQCDTATQTWSVDFYEEPVNADSNDASSQATRHAVCPGNGYLTKNPDGKLVLQCNYWESTSNVSKRLEFELMPSTGSGHRGMRWLSRDIDNPNTVCGIAGRADDSVIVGTGNN